MNKNNLRVRARNLTKFAVIMCMSAFGCLGAATTVLAEESNNAKLEVITVTARKIEENLQDIPIAITAFDAEAIKRRNITELEDVARFTAGFAFEDFDGGNASPVIRGQATLRASAREQTVATFMDGIYMPRAWLVDMGTSNIERIEVVKGPQSARYGRNAFAGAINYVSQSPSEEFEGDISLTIGDDDRQEIGGSISGALVEDLISARLSFEDTEYDGSWGNNHPNANSGLSPGTDGNVGGWDNRSWSAAISLTPSDRMKIDATYYNFEKSEEARAARWLNTRTGIGNCGNLQPTDGGGTGNSLFCGEYPAPAGEATIEPRGFGRQSDTDILRLAASFEASEALDITYQYGQIEADTVTANTAESDPINCGTILGPPVFPSLCNFQASPLGDVEYKQHEIRLAFNNGGKFSWATGAFMLEGEDRSFSVSANVAPGATIPLSVSTQTSAADPFPSNFRNFVFRDEFTTTDSWSIFAEFSYDISARTRIGVEARYTEEEIETFNTRTDPDTLIGNDTFDFITPRLTVEHDLSDTNLIYFTVARGAKAGGFNSGAISPSLQVFDPEFNWTYEVGSKLELCDGAAVLNSAIFMTQWDDQQVNALDPMGSPFTAALTRNLGNATVYGIEFEGSYQVNENFRIDGAASYTDASYDSGTVDELFVAGTAFFPAPCDDIVCSSAGDIGGNDIERSPDTQISIGLQWEADFNANSSYYIRGDVGYQSSFFADQINAASAPDRTVTNARIGYKYNNIEASLWARNLFDESYVSNSLQILQPFSNNILGTYFGERRTVGATLKLDF